MILGHVSISRTQANDASLASAWRIGARQKSRPRTIKVSKSGGEVLPLYQNESAGHELRIAGYKTKTATSDISCAV